MSVLSSTAMVLAAGQGVRMRPLTLTKPKPLQEVGGRTMLDSALDKLAQARIERVVVNTCYLAEQIEDHLKTRRDMEVIISRENELLDTGGGVARALPYFNNLPFFVLNADLPWTDGATPSLEHMRQKWDGDKMDALLLVMKTGMARGFDLAKGDYAMDAQGRLRCLDVPRPRPYVMIAAQIMAPSLYANPAAPAFSNKLLWDKAEAKNRLYGIEHEGTCFHVGTPEDLHDANMRLASGQGWAV